MQQILMQTFINLATELARLLLERIAKQHFGFAVVA